MVRRKWLYSGVAVAVLGWLTLWSSAQRVEILKQPARLDSAKHTSIPSDSLPTSQVVFLEVHEFGYSAFVRAEAEELSYDHFAVRNGALVLEGGEDTAPPLTVDARTRLTANVEQSTSAYYSAAHPRVLDHIPWVYVTDGAPLWATVPPKPARACLRHRFSISNIAADGTVIAKVGSRRVLLEPGGAFRVRRALGPWSSTVTIAHRGIFPKGKVLRSPGLRVGAD